MSDSYRELRKAIVAAVAERNALRVEVAAEQDRVIAIGVERDALRQVLAELVRQIAISDFKDSHGHEALKLRAYAKARQTLAKPAAA